LDLKSQSGKKSNVAKLQATQERIAQFAAAVNTPVSNGDVSVAPPTFMTTCRESEFELFEKLSIPLSSILHAEQLYTYGEPIRPGDELEFQTELSSVLEKSGGSGKMAFLTFDTKIDIARVGAGSKLNAGNSRTTVVVRQKA
jgi:hypothetical protein